MDDRTLLERAAKAHGGIPMRCVGAAPGLYYCEEAGKPRSHPQWNPLNDDGDAFRLAVKLKLNIMQGDFSVGVNDESEIDEVLLVGGEEERAETTRRAIVRAAAEIGGERSNG